MEKRVLFKSAWLPWVLIAPQMAIILIFVPLFEVVIVSLAIMLVLGPVVMVVSEGIASALMWVYEISPAISGLVIGGFYQCLVIFGLHWAVIPIVAKNCIRYQLLARTRVGRAYLERWGERTSDALLAKYFGEQRHDVGELAL